jgi:hypothetical protein
LGIFRTPVEQAVKLYALKNGVVDFRQLSVFSFNDYSGNIDELTLEGIGSRKT